MILTNYFVFLSIPITMFKTYLKLIYKNKNKMNIKCTNPLSLRHKYKLKSQNGHWKTIFQLFDKENFNVFPTSSSQRLLILNWATPHYTLNPVTSCFLALEIAEPGKNQEWSWILNHFHPHSYPLGIAKHTKAWWNLLCQSLSLWFDFFWWIDAFEDWRCCRI